MKPRVALAAVALLAALVAATNEWPSWDGAVDLLKIRDVLSYEAIAQAAPSLPDAELPAQHAQRFPAHWLVGSVSESTGLGLHATYRVAWGLLVLLIVLAVNGVLARLDLSPGARWLCLGALVANPYLFRLTAIGPALLADLVFVLGAAVALLGVVRERAWILLAGLALAALARETAVLVALPLAAYLALAPDRATGERRLALPAAALVLPAAIVGAARLVANGFSAPSHYGLSDLPGVPAPESITELTILDSIAELSESLTEPIDHALRLLLPSVPLLALAAGAWLVLRSRGAQVPRLAWAALAAWAMILAVPFLLNPDVVAHNQTRLGALGAPALVVAVGALLARAEEARPLALSSVRVMALAGVGFFAVSLHHKYARIGPESDAQYALLATAVAGGLAALVWRALTRQPPTRA